MPIDINKPLSLRLRDLAEHLEGLDSASPEAAMMREAAGRIDLADQYPSWESINSASIWSDDIIWLYNSASRSIEGPRPFFEYDADKFDYWAPCEPPPLPDNGTPTYEPSNDTHVEL